MLAGRSTPPVSVGTERDVLQRRPVVLRQGRESLPGRGWAALWDVFRECRHRETDSNAEKFSVVAAGSGAMWSSMFR